MSTQCPKGGSHKWKLIRRLKNGNKIYECKKCGATTTEK